MQTRPKAARWRGPLAIICFLAALAPAVAQQAADPDFTPEIAEPAYARDSGPQVLIDEAHHNFHTASGRYAPFAALVRQDGYRPGASQARFTPDALAGVPILVVANALSERNLATASLPTYAAFTAEEIAAVTAWVEGGGSLLLIADHMPWGGAAAELAQAFGVLFSDGYAIGNDGSGTRQFRDGSGLAADHPLVRGRSGAETVDSVMTFTGQAFRVRPGVDVRPVMTFGPETVLLMPVEAWRFSQQTPRLSAEGMLQGATLEYGAGRVAVFGEAAMFSAQISARGARMGMNHPEARDNARFALNVMHWLSRLY
jgi:hypothetical protein